MQYFAGLFDAEGYVSLSKEGRFQIGTEMANEEIPNLFKNTFGGNIYKRQRDTRKPTWTWVISTNIDQSINFINSISPFSIIKSCQLVRLGDYLVLDRVKRRELRDITRCTIANYKIPFPITKNNILGIGSIDKFDKIPDENFWKWFSGFLDGDGNFCIYEYKGKRDIIFDTTISAFNIHGAAIAHIYDRIKGSISQKSGSKFPVFGWSCCEKESISVCESILPHLFIKKKQCSLILDFFKIKKTKVREQPYSFDDINRIRDLISQLKHLNSL